jgi:hypothetical protein
MSFRKSALILVFFSLSCFFLTFFLLQRYLPPESGSGYAVLSLPASYPDRMIRNLLTGKGGPGTGEKPVFFPEDALISESSQWVFLNDFEDLKKIHLDVYREQVENFDPRDDGYAERLKSFFVRGDRRFFFLSFKSDFTGAGFKKLEKNIAFVLGDIPFSLSFMGYPKPLFWYFVLFVCAACAALFLSEKPLLTLSSLPIFLALLFAGSLGFALSGVLAALSGLIREPLGEFFASSRYGSRGRRFNGLRGCFEPYKKRRLLILGFILLYGAFCLIGAVPPLAAAAAGLGFFLVLWLFLWADSNRGKAQAHIRFTPVLILDLSARGFVPRLILPFTLASLLSLGLPFFVSSLSPPPEQNLAGASALLITKAEYENHVRFQSLFSLRPLGTGPEDVPQNAYLRYALGEDGLIAGFSGVRQSMNGSDFPPFPLEGLMDFLVYYSNQPQNLSPVNVRELIPALLMLLCSFLVVFRVGKKDKKKKKMVVINDKRIAA